MNNKITALIPTYKRPTLLRRAILSVLNQSYTNLQVCVFDNASTDKTQSMVDALIAQDGRIRYHCHPKNIGSLQNFKFAFQSVDTPYFSILSDDDALAFDFYENASKVLDENPDIMFAILNTLTIDKETNLIGDRENTQQLTFYRGNKRLNAENIPMTWTSILFRKEIANIYTSMDSRFDIASDIRFLLHAKARYNFAYLSKVGAFFMDHSNSTSANRRRFDIVHHVTQISRYIEIYYDDNINYAIKENVILSIKNMLKPTKKQFFYDFIDTLKIAIKTILTSGNIDNKYCHDEIRGAKEAGLPISAFVLTILYQNKYIQKIIHVLLFRYYQKQRLRHQINMRERQHTQYKQYFDKLNGLST